MMETSTLARIGVNQRRSWRFAQPGAQIRLVASVLGITGLFALLALGNSFAAYSGLMGSALATAPPPLAADVRTQTDHYLVVSLALGLGYAFAMIAVCVSFVHRLTGPNVALIRHARALKGGDCSSRIELRGGDGVYTELARHLNELAVRLEREERAAQRLESPLIGGG